MKKTVRRKRAANSSPQAKQPVNPTKKKIADGTVIYPANVGHHGTDKEELLNAEE